MRGIHKSQTLEKQQVWIPRARQAVTEATVRDGEPEVLSLEPGALPHITSVAAAHVLPFCPQFQECRGRGTAPTDPNLKQTAGQCHLQVSGWRAQPGLPKIECTHESPGALFKMQIPSHQVWDGA